jgi:hypothetical protein
MGVPMVTFRLYRAKGAILLLPSLMISWYEGFVIAFAWLFEEYRITFTKDGD